MSIFAYSSWRSWREKLRPKPGESRGHAEMRARRRQRKAFRRAASGGGEPE